jgi:hypothetical protein
MTSLEISPAAVEFLASKFRRWIHPRNRKDVTPLELGDGEHQRVEQLIHDLFWICNQDSVKQDPHIARIGERLVVALNEIGQIPNSNEAKRDAITRELLNCVEPFCLILTRLLREAEWDSLVKSKATLPPILKRMQDCGMTPFRLSRTSEEFKKGEGREKWHPFENAVFDVLAGRLLTAHQSPSFVADAWESPTALLLSLVDHNAKRIHELGAPAASERPRLSARQVPATGVPTHRRLPVGSPEPFTTRAGPAKAWASRIGGTLARGGCLAVVRANPGWGKSFFLSAALDDASAPVHFTSLANCSTPHQLADALLIGLQVSEGERQSIDLNPLRATSVLDDRLGRKPAILVFENIHQNSSPFGPAALRDFALAFLRLGHLPIFETWDAGIPWLSAVPQAQIDVCEQSEMPRLDVPEIAEWGQRLLSRPLSNNEIEVLEIFEGHPLGLRRALELLRSREGLPIDAIEDALLLLLADWQKLHTSFAEFLERGHVSTLRHDGLALSPEFIWWFGLFPFADLEIQDIPQALHQQIFRHLDLGLVSRVENRIRPEVWARVLGIAQLQRPLDLPRSSTEFTRALCESVPAHRLEMQGRHLLRIAHFSPSVSDLIDSLELELRKRITDASPTEIAREEYEYDAPAEPELLAKYSHATPSERGLPLPLRLWLLESAGRAGNTADVEARLQSFADSDELRNLKPAWLVAKAFHRAVLSLRGDETTRRRIYELAQSALDALSINSGGDSVWVARFKIAAAANALATGDRESAARLRASASELLATSRGNLTQDASASHLYQDSMYRLLELDSRFAQSLQEKLAAETRILEIIPLDGRIAPQFESRWRLRELRHLTVVLRSTPDDPRLRQRMSTLIRRAPLNAALVRRIANIFQSFGRDSEVSNLVAKEVQHKARSSGARQTAAISLERLTTLVLGPPPADTHLVDWGVVASQEIAAGDPSTALLILECMWLLRGNDIRLRRRPSGRLRVARLVNKSLAELSAETALSGIERRLSNACLAAEAEVFLFDVRKDLDEMRGGTFDDVLNLFERAGRRIDGAYRTALRSHQNASLLIDWAGFAIEVVKQLNAAARERRHSRELIANGPAIEESLRALAVEIDATSPGEPSGKLASLRLYRYLWDWERSRNCLPNLAGSHSNFFERARIGEAILSTLGAIAFAPASLPLPSAKLTAPELQLLRTEILGIAAQEPVDGRRNWLTQSVSALQAPEDLAVWSQILEMARKLLGGSRNFWERLVDLIQAEGDGDRALGEELADETELWTAARVLYFGAGNAELPPIIRQELAELAFLSYSGAGAWRRSSTGRADFRIPFLLGTCVGLGLSASPDGRFLDAPSPPISRRGKRVQSWEVWMHGQLNSTYMVSVGAFRAHCKSTMDRLRHSLGRNRGRSKEN